MPCLPRPTPDRPLDGQESVWAFPRPARLQPTTRHLRVEFGGKVLAEARSGFRTIETSPPPSYYFPPADVDMSMLRQSLREWKGRASYFDVVVGSRTASGGAWTYRDPAGPFLALKDHIAFYAGAMDLCSVDGEPVRPQAGDFYGGCITPEIAGPFKGPPGTEGW